MYVVYYHPRWGIPPVVDYAAPVICVGYPLRLLLLGLLWALGIGFVCSVGFHVFDV